MNTPITIRSIAFVASILVTFGAVWVIADYAYPEAPAVRLVTASH